MKKILRVTTALSCLLFLIPFMTYQTSRMRQPASFGFLEFFRGKSFSVDGLVYSSGVNTDALLAILFALAAVAAAWLLKNLAMRIGVGVSSVLSVVFLTRSVGLFSKNAAFAIQLNEVVKGGIEFTTNIFFAIIIAILLCSVLICLATEKFSRNMLKYKWYFLMLVPSILFFVVFAYIPMAGIVIGFLDYNISDIWQSSWAGLKWFRHLIDNLDGEFGQVLVNTVVVAVGKMAIGFPAPIILALLFNECRGRVFRRTVQTISYLPYFISWSIIGGLIISLASTDYSIVNGVVKTVTGNDRGFYLLNEAQYIRWTMILSNVWKNVGWGTVIYMAALSGVNPEIYESAIMDGAGRLAQTRYITLPGISHIITLQLILSTPNLLADNFDQTMNLVYPTTIVMGRTLSQYIYEIGLRGAGKLGMGGNYSYSTVIGLCNSVLSMILLVVANSIGKRINEEGAIW